MSESDDIQEFMGLVGKGSRKATRYGMAEVQRQIAEVTQDPNLVLVTRQIGPSENPPICLKTWSRRSFSRAEVQAALARFNRKFAK